VQEEGSLPSERSGEGGAKRRSAQAKRGRLGCLLRAPEADLSGRLGFLVGRGAHEIALRCCCCNGAGVAGRNRTAEKGGGRREAAEDREEPSSLER
jgi:hypothetical protein